MAGSPLTELPLLAREACEAVRADVLAAQPAWTRRHPDAPFYTLGAASYLDGDAPARYRALTEGTNPLLGSTFGPLLRQVAAALAAHLGEPVVPTTRHGLPGFHIFRPHPAFERSVTRIHVDRPHLALDWGVPAAALPALTFTLPIALPRAGAGLDHWPIRGEEWLPLAPEARVALLKARPRTHHAYTLGTLVLHDGDFVHRIAPSRGLGPGDDRVTYHGHGVRLEGVWHLYW